MTLPVAAARIPGELAFVLDVHGVGRREVSVSAGRATVEPPDESAEAEGRRPDFHLWTEPDTLIELVTGEARPLRLMMAGRLRIRGKRRRALRLRHMAGAEVSLTDFLQPGAEVDPDVLYRSMPYLIDPAWTKGHEFTVRHQVTGEGGGEWYIQVRDGRPLVVTADAPADRDAAATATMSFDAYQQVLARRVSPSEAMQRQMTTIVGELYPLTVLGRWIARSQGQDDEEIEREARQREIQVRRAGLYAANGAHPGQGDPGHDGAPAVHDGYGLLDYRQLYALWERQNWRASEIDFEVDREHWVVSPREAQESTLWSLGSFYVGEERVTADLAPFLLAAPSGEIELFLATQLVDEARHAAFFDRFGAEVMCLSSEDLRGRMREVEQVLLQPWRDVFDDGLRDVAARIQKKPDDFGLFVEGITTYHMIVEGFLAVTGQTLIRDYFVEHGMYPGFCEGFGLVERDEHRHVAFGVRFLRDAINDDPRHRATVERVVLELAPRAAYVFAPPYVEDARDYVSYGYTSRQIYGYAYRTLKRRMKVLGIEIPPPEELMPGPIAEPAVPSVAPSSPSGVAGNGAREAGRRPATPNPSR
jgi:ribonucleoside-diphosphate reductase beta chain